MSEKIIGYLLLISGIVIIAFAAINVYWVFTGVTRPVNLFKFDGISIDTKAISNTPNIDTSNLSAQQAEIIGQIFKEDPDKPTKIEIIPADIINQTANVFAQIILMGFIASIGYKIAGLGVLMLRPIVVKLKQKDSQSYVEKKETP